MIKQLNFSKEHIIRNETLVTAPPAHIELLTFSLYVLISFSVLSSIVAGLAGFVQGVQNEFTCFGHHKAMAFCCSRGPVSFLLASCNGWTLSLITMKLNSLHSLLRRMKHISAYRRNPLDNDDWTPAT